MSWQTGVETIGAKLERLRGDLARVRQTITSVESNGQDFALGGVSVSMVAYDAAQSRERNLVRQISALEARLAGASSSSGSGIATIRTKLP